MKKLFFELVLLISVFMHLMSCGEQLSRTYTQKSISFAAVDGDTVFRQGKEYIFKLTLNPGEHEQFIQNNEPLYLSILYYSYSDNRIFYDSLGKMKNAQVLKLTKQKGDTLVCRFKIPERTNSIDFFICSNEHELYGYQVNKGIVFNNLGLEMGAIYPVINQISDDCTAMVNDYIQNYPEDYLVYIPKWNNHLKVASKTKDRNFVIQNIKKDLQRIETFKNDTVKYLLKMIGYNFSERENDAMKLLYKVSNYKYLSAFNDMYFSGLFYNFFDILKFKDDKEEKEIQSKIMKNNPLSFYTNQRISDGTISRIDFKIADEILKIRSNNGFNNINNAIETCFLYAYHINDSLQAAEKILNRLIDKLNTKNFFERQEQYVPQIFIKRGIYLPLIRVIYEKLNKVDTAISKINQLRAGMDALDACNSILLADLGRLYQIKNVPDSAIKYLAVSYKYQPSEKIKSRLRIIHDSILKQKDDFEHWFDYVLKNTKSENFLKDKSLKINTNKETVPLTNNDKIIILEFFTTTCAPCQINMATIKKLMLKDKFKNKIKVFAVSPESREPVEQYFKEKGFNLDYVENNMDLMRQLNIANVPFTLVLNKNGEVVYFDYGGSKNKELPLEEIINELLK